MSRLAGVLGVDIYSDVHINEQLAGEGILVNEVSTVCGAPLKQSSCQISELLTPG